MKKTLEEKNNSLKTIKMNTTYLNKTLVSSAILLISFSLTCFSQTSLINGGFENGLSNWNNLSSNGSIGTYSISSDAAEGSNSLKVEVTKLGPQSYNIQNIYKGGWSAEIGKTYKINFYAKSPNSNTELRVIQATNGFKSSNFGLTSEWKLYEFIYVAVGTTEKLGMHFSNLATYFVDGFTIEPFNIEAESIPPSSNSSLKDLAAPFGINIANLGDRTDEPDFEQILRNDFNMLGSENGLKMILAKRSENGPYTLSGPDKMVAYAEANDMKVRGHTILWHNGLPEWIKNKNWTRQTLLDFLEGYIKDVVGRYKGQIDEWDVANEFVNNEGTGLRTADESIWIKYIGPEVLDLAFQWIHEVDPDAKLYYNDYSAEGLNGKSNYIYNMVKDMQVRGIPIHGVGFQGHFKYDQFLTPNVTFAQEIDANIKRLGALGLEVAFTEIDISITTPVEPSDYNLQAITYGNLLQIALNNSDIVKTFMMWGITDKYTWITDNTEGKFGDPLFYDKNYNKKPAYDKMVQVLKAKNAELSVSNNEVTKNKLVVYPNPSTTGFFYLNKSAEWKVYTIHGVLVKEGLGNKIDLSTSSKGFYIIKTILDTKYIMIK